MPSKHKVEEPRDSALYNPDKNYKIQRSDSDDLIISKETDSSNGEVMILDGKKDIDDLDSDLDLQCGTFDVLKKFDRTYLLL